MVVHNQEIGPQLYLCRRCEYGVLVCTFWSHRCGALQLRSVHRYDHGQSGDNCQNLVGEKERKESRSSWWYCIRSTRHDFIQEREENDAHVVVCESDILCADDASVSVLCGGWLGAAGNRGGAQEPRLFESRDQLFSVLSDGVKVQNWIPEAHTLLQAQNADRCSQHQLHIRVSHVEPGTWDTQLAGTRVLRHVFCVDDFSENFVPSKTSLFA